VLAKLGQYDWHPSEIPNEYCATPQNMYIQLVRKTPRNGNQKM